PTAVATVGKLLQQVGGDAQHFRLALLGRDAGLQPPDDVQEFHAQAALALLRRERQRHPEVGEGWEAESGRHHADDGVVVAVERNGAAEHATIATEPLLPQAVAEHGDAIASWFVFLWREGAPEHGRYTHSGEERRCRQYGAHSLGLTAARQVLRSSPSGKGRHTLETPGIFRVIAIPAGRDAGTRQVHL